MTSTSTAAATRTGSGLETPFTVIARTFRTAQAASDERKWAFAEGELDIEPLLAAVSTFLIIFDALGSVVITELVRKDFGWKMGALRAAVVRLKAVSSRDVVRREVAAPPRMFDASGIEALQWVNRILQFVDGLVARMISDPALELKDACTESYRATLATRHPKITRSIFEKALSLVPSRARFFANISHVDIASEQDLRRNLAGMDEFRLAVAPHIGALTTMFISFELSPGL